MLLIVATRGRPDRQITLDQLIEAGLHQTDQVVVVGTTTEDRPQRLSPEVEFHTSGTSNLTEKRNWILDTFGATNKMIVFDDDLRFSFLNQETGRYARGTPKQLAEGLRKVWDLLDHYPLAGCLAKFIARGRPENEVEVNGKVWHMIGTNFGLIKTFTPRFFGVLHQDTEMNIQMLHAGYSPAIYTHMTHEDVPNKPGGCSIYRNAQLKARTTLDLMRRYPGYVDMTDLGAERVAWAKLKRRCTEIQEARL